jgi:MFS family permease
LRRTVTLGRATLTRPVLAPGAGLLVATYAFAVAMLGTTLPTPLYASYRVEFGFSVLMITVIFATYAVGVITGLLLFGRMSDQIGRRRTLLPGLALSALSAVAFLAADGLPLLLAGRVLSGLSAGIFTGAATATIVDLAGPERRVRATLVATAANMGGLGCGPLLSGILSEYAANPLRLAFIVHLGLLALAAVGIWAMPEPVERTGPLRLRPQRPRVPASARGVFVSAALAGFAGFAVLGVFTAVVPAFMGAVLDVHDHAVVGVVVFVVFVASTAGQAALERIPAALGLVAGCAGLIAGMAVFALGLAVASLALLVLGGVVAGLGQGLGFRAGLAAVNRAAPADQRGEVASAFFIVAYVALSLPVVGVGLLAQVWSLKAAGLIFAAVVSALALAVLAAARRLTPAVA